VVLRAEDAELTVAERFFDGFFGTVWHSVVSLFSPEPVQTLVEQGFGGAEGIADGSFSSVMVVIFDSVG